jgi:hypothetical protein
VSAVSTFFSRFTVKFIEVVGAGVATALTGYLLAHFGGYFNAQSNVPIPPAAVQIAPGTGVPGSSAPNATVVTKGQRAQPAQAAASASADAKEPRRAQPGETATPASLQSERTTVGSVPSSSTHRRVPPELAAVETRARETDSVEARIRAALANVDASHQPPPEGPARPPDVVTAAPKVSIPAAAVPAAAPPPAAAGPVTAALPPVADVHPAGAGPAVERAPTPRGPETATAPVQPAATPQATSEPLPAVEVKSLPVASVDQAPPVAAAVTAHEAPKEDEPGILSAIKKIPDFLRGATPAPAPADKAPRPPLSVGE